ncbi:hypothetical protein [Elizabethkingia anophelis]|uniref:hypothetical protein n=1 Tax=Elizabethkingia anophelis TaxID=1117645 RepID=UPI0038929F96
MELKEYIKGVLSDITEGIKEAMVECEKHGGHVNPRGGIYTVGEENKFYSYLNENKGDKYYLPPMHNVDFNITLEVSNEQSKVKSLGVSKIFVASTEKDTTNFNKSRNTISFSVPIVFPYSGYVVDVNKSFELRPKE